MGRRFNVVQGENGFTRLRERKPKAKKRSLELLGKRRKEGRTSERRETNFSCGAHGRRQKTKTSGMIRRQGHGEKISWEEKSQGTNKKVPASPQKEGGKNLSLQQATGRSISLAKSVRKEKGPGVRQPETVPSAVSGRIAQRKRPKKSGLPLGQWLKPGLP